MKRTYKQFCGVARALDILGERWTLLVVRNLLLGPRRYSDLLRELPGVTTNLLAKRLQEMEGSGLIERLDGPAGVSLYGLTARGAALEPVIMELGRWGGPLMVGGPRRGDRVSLGWALLSTKRRYAGGLVCVVEVNADEGESFELVFAPDRLGVAQRPASRPDLLVTGSAEALRRAFASPDEGDAAAAIRRLDVKGPPALWRGVLLALGRATGKVAGTEG